MSKTMRHHWTAATSIASLAGTRPAVTLELGKKRLRALPFSKLSQSDFDSNQDSGLHQHTEHVQLGSVDAFISHSWRDSPVHKWLALSKWAADFEQILARPSLVWLDKACIAQSSDIDEQLSCLPVFLAGCQQFLVLAGPTYLERMWCLIEVFCYYRMGGDEAHMKLLPLPPASAPIDPDARLQKAILYAALERFECCDAGNARCYHNTDREHLLAVIESGFGSVQCFNELMRTTFSELLSKR